MTRASDYSEGVTALVGAWRLVSSVSETEAGETSNLGTNPATVGYLIYSADGHMAAIIMYSSRPAFAAEDPHGGTPEEKLAAYDNVTCITSKPPHSRTG